MIKLKTTHEIFSMPWKQSTNTIPINSKRPPPWKDNREVTINDVHFWEELYYEPGNIGVYVAWSPYTEFYMIAYNLFVNEEFGILTFHGPDAAIDVSKKLAKLGIMFKVDKIWIT
jgi:hypothetical protein